MLLVTHKLSYQPGTLTAAASHLSRSLRQSKPSVSVTPSFFLRSPLSIFEPRERKSLEAIISSVSCA